MTKQRLTSCRLKTLISKPRSPLWRLTRPSCEPGWRSWRKTQPQEDLMTRMLPWRILLKLLQPKQQRLLLKLRLNLPKNPRKLLKLFNQLRPRHQLTTKVLRRPWMQSPLFQLLQNQHLLQTLLQLIQLQSQETRPVELSERNNNSGESYSKYFQIVNSVNVLLIRLGNKF